MGSQSENAPRMLYLKQNIIYILPSSQSSSIVLHVCMYDGCYLDISLLNLISQVHLKFLNFLYQLGMRIYSLSQE